MSLPQSPPSTVATLSAANHVVFLAPNHTPPNGSFRRGPESMLKTIHALQGATRPNPSSPPLSLGLDPRATPRLP